MGFEFATELGFKDGKRLGLGIEIGCILGVVADDMGFKDGKRLGLGFNIGYMLGVVADDCVGVGAFPGIHCE